MSEKDAQKSIIVTAKDLPLHCPMPEMVSWNSHPRVFLDVVDTGSVRCPYCSTVYTLKAGEIIKGH